MKIKSFTYFLAGGILSIVTLTTYQHYWTTSKINETEVALGEIFYEQLQK